LTISEAGAIVSFVSDHWLRQRLLRWLRILGPWAVAVGLLTWVFSRIPLDAFGQALSRGQFSWWVPTMAGALVCIYLADSLAITKTFSWFTAPLSYAEVLAIRGASYLLAVINYNLGQGAIVFFVRRAKGVPLGLGTGTVLLIMGINLVVLLVLAVVGLSVSVVPRAAALWPWAIGLLVAFLGYLGVVAIRPAWLERYDLLKPALRAGIRGHLAALAVRLPHLGAVFAAHYLAMRAFGVHPPVAVFLTYMPIVTLISALPISPQGLGTQQVAAIYLFSAYAPGDPETQRATVLAYSVSIVSLAMVFQVGMGLAWMRRAMVLLGLRAATASAEASEGAE